MAIGQRALDLAMALGERALQVHASLYLGQVCYVLGDFGRATEFLQWSMEAADREGDPPVPTCGPDPRHGWRGPCSRARGLHRGPALRGGGAPSRHAGRPRARPGRCPPLPRPPVSSPGGPGARHPGVGAGPGPLSCLRQPQHFASDRGGAWLCRSAPGTPRGGACCWGRRSAKVAARARWANVLTMSPGSATSVVWRDATRRPGSTPAEALDSRPTAAVTRRRGPTRCTSWRRSMPMRDPPDAAPA